jgi:hypothetical protein
MESTSSAVGLIVIVALYVTIGVMSAAGSVYIAKSIFSAKVEQIFFGGVSYPNRRLLFGFHGLLWR